MTATWSRRVWALVLTGASLTVMAAACGSDGGGSPGGAEGAASSDEDRGRELVETGDVVRGGTMIIGVSAETDGWSPQGNNFADAGSFVVASVLEPLAVYGPDGQAVPHLAESWEPNDDFTRWTVELRAGITFHDGEAFDAEVVRRNIEKALEGPLVGTGLRPVFDDPPVEVVDDLTVTFRLSTPMATFPASVLTLQGGLMVSPNMLDEPDLGSRAPVGTGPFVFDDWIEGDRFVAIRNPDYWRDGEDGERLPYLDRIEFRVMVDSTTRANALNANDIDMMYTTRAADIARYRQQEDVTLIEDNRSEVTFVQLNHSVPPFDNEHARRAVAMAVDQTAVNEVLGENISQPASGPWHESEPFYNPDHGYVGFDPDGARQALEAYRSETGESELSFSLKGLPSVDDTRLLQLLQEMWGNVGIEVNVETVEQTQFIAAVAFGDFEAAFFRNFSFTEPDAQYVFFHSNHIDPDGISINFPQMSSEEVDRLLDEARRTGSPEDRNRLYADFVPALNAELAYVWLFNTPYALVAHPEVRGLNHARELGFGNFEPKWWVGELWVDR
jgi:peptide/nickel transport system substrate-binding protein